MNERIKEMWEEATVSVWPRPGKFTAGEYDYHLANFAELIVLECAEVGLDSVEDGDDLDAIMKRVHNNILKHFGVEE
jgi:hypothetical protein